MTRITPWFAGILLVALTACGGGGSALPPQLTLPYELTGKLESTDLSFTRPDFSISGLLADVPADGRAVFYDVLEFSVPKTEFYKIGSEQNFDAFFLLYKDSFDAAAPDKNLVVYKDGGYRADSNPKDTAVVTLQLEAGVAYTLVTTAYNSKDEKTPPLGDYKYTIEGGQAAPPATFTLPPPDPSKFNITVRFVNNDLTQQQQAVFVKAGEIWSQVISKDVQDAPNFSLPQDFIFPSGPVSGTLDDLLIEVSTVNEPEGTFLARAGPVLVRDNSFSDVLIPAYGFMEINLAVIESDLSDPVIFEDTIVHEMGHVLGIGTTWEATQNLQGVEEEPAPVDLGLPNPDYDPRFIGANAVTAYKEILAASGRPAEDTVPVENTGGGGSINGHWREFLFDTELMASQADAVNEPLSKLTAASLIDIGYTVNLDSAAIESYALPAPATFEQLEPTATIYEEGLDFIKVDRTGGSATGLVQAVNLFIDEAADPNDPTSKHPANSTSGCEESDFAGFTSGRIALIQRGTCAFTDKVANAQTAGAAGVILFNQGNAPDRQGFFAPSVEGATVPVIAIPFEFAKDLSAIAGLRVEIDVPVSPPALRALRGKAFDISSREILLAPMGTISATGKIQLNAGYSGESLMDEIAAQFDEQIPLMVSSSDR